nr:serine/threonine-protein kinase PKH2 [Danio rerio]|eukprot:XP_021324348.1 serine/threonine-protein kinase PKH2 [Danio rerio]
MLFTVLGVVALFLRERNISSTVSGQDESFDRQEGLVTEPPVANSDGREIGDWCEESSLQEPDSVHGEEPSLVEPDSVHGEEQSLVEPVSVHSEEPSLVEPDSVHGEEPSLVEPDSVHGEEPSLVEPDSVHGEEQSLVEPDSVHGEEPSLVEPDNVHGEEPSLVEPDSVHGEEPSLVEPDSVHGEEPSLVEPDSVHGEEQSLVEPDSVHGEEPSLVEPDSVHGEEQSLVEPVSVHSEEPSLVEPDSVHGEEPSLVEPVSVHSEEPSLVEPDISSYSSFFSAKSGCGDDTSTNFESAESGCGDDTSTNFESAESGCGDDTSTNFESAESEKLKDEDTHIIEINSQHYKIGAELGKGGFGTVFAGTRLEDGLQVAVKIVDSKAMRLIKVGGFEKPLPSEIALHYLATKGPRVKQIAELLDWKVEAERYIIVVERLIPSMNLREFLIDNKEDTPEDLVRKIMFNVTIAAHTCCQRGVFHSDIKLENLLINPETFEVKLIDFGCSVLLTKDCYHHYSGTRLFAPPEFLNTGRYHGEPATVWSLGILQFLLLFKKYPVVVDLFKLHNRDIEFARGSKGEIFSSVTDGCV